MLLFSSQLVTSNHGSGNSEANSNATVKRSKSRSSRFVSHSLNYKRNLFVVITKNFVTACIVCDSRKSPECANDTIMNQPNNSFKETCDKGLTWCYKAKGRVYTLAYDIKGHKEKMEKMGKSHKHEPLIKRKLQKVDRGCARPKNVEECVRVTQDDKWTNFTVCHCKDELCNMYITTDDLPLKNPNAAGRIAGEFRFFLQCSIFIALIFFLGY